MKEITPKHLQCGVGLCPAVFELDDGQIAIIGSKINHSALPDEIVKKIGSNERVVLLPLEYIKGIK